MQRATNMMRLHNLQPRPGSRHRVKRLGCGESSGQGKTSGKRHKGLKVEADKISTTAREKIDKAGGTITLREKGAAVAAGSSTEEPSGAPAPKAIGKKKSKTSAKAKKKASRES